MENKLITNIIVAIIITLIWLYMNKKQNHKQVLEMILFTSIVFLIVESIYMFVK